MRYLAILKFDESQHPRDKEGQFTVSQDEETAVQNYTRLFKGTNTLLRLIGPKGQDISDTGADRPTRHMVQYLDQVIASHPLLHDTTLYRVAPEKIAASWNAGDVIQDFAYTSTSKTPEALTQVARDIGLVKGTRSFKTVRMTIHAPQGLGHVDVNAVMQARPQDAPHRYAHQQEVLLPRGTAFTVASKHRNAKGVLEVVLEAQTRG